MISVSIYELFESDTLEVRYVGQTVEPEARLAWHTQAAKRGEKRWVYNWIRNLLKRGAVPVMRVIEECHSDQEANERESHWILLYRSYGVDLTNLTDGGGGIRGMKHSEETKVKIGLGNLGKKMTPDYVRAMSIARKGVPLSPEHRVKAVAALRRRVWTQAQKDQISERMRGNKCGLGKVKSPELLAHMAKTLSGENGARAKCTNEQAVQIRKMFSDGMKQSVIADSLGLSRVDVHRIVRRKTYTLIGDL